MGAFAGRESDAGEKAHGDYLSMQGRFKAMGMGLRLELQEMVDEEWTRLLRKCSENH